MNHSLYPKKRGAKMADKIRVQFDFTPAALAQLDTLQERLKAKSRAEVIRYALRVLQWLLDQLKDSAKIMVESKDGKVETVVFTFLDASEPARTEQPAAAAMAAGARS
jgi:hypothetical protein